MRSSQQRKGCIREYIDVRNARTICGKVHGQRLQVLAIPASRTGKGDCRPSRNSPRACLAASYLEAIASRSKDTTRGSWPYY